MIKKYLEKLIRIAIKDNLWIDTECEYELSNPKKLTNIIIRIGFDDEVVLSKKIEL